MDWNAGSASLGISGTKTEITMMMKRRRYIYVQDHEGYPLMPTSPARARQMLRSGDAVLVDRSLFVIRLTKPSASCRQETAMGVDFGSCHVGVSVTTDRRELLSSEVLLRDDVSQRLLKRREMRRGRRFRKTRYRAARFDNRTASKKTGWLAPSVRHKVESIAGICERIGRILPISKVICEGGRFDAQAVMNPGIKGKEYQEGLQSDFDNVKAYVRWRDGYTCQNCGAHGEGIRIEVHHIRHRMEGGSDRPDNLVSLCHGCHWRHHNEGMELKVKKPVSMRNMSMMNAIRKRAISELRKSFPEVHETWGYITTRNRTAAEIHKSHANDAFVISGNLHAERTGYIFLWRQIPRHSRRLHEEVPHRGGARKSKVAAKWIVAKKTGIMFRRFDRVKVNGCEGIIAGSTNGSLVIKDIRWKPTAGVKASISPNKVKLVSRQRGGYIIGIENNENNSARSLFET